MKVEGKVVGNGNVDLQDGSKVGGKVESGGDLKLRGDIKIEEKVRSNGNLEFEGGVVKIGSKVGANEDIRVKSKAVSIVR